MKLLNNVNLTFQNKYWIYFLNNLDNILIDKTIITLLKNKAQNHF